MAELQRKHHRITTTARAQRAIAAGGALALVDQLRDHDHRARGATTLSPSD